MMLWYTGKAMNCNGMVLCFMDKAMKRNGAIAINLTNYVLQKVHKAFMI